MQSPRPHTTVPNSVPTPAVSAIASAPQNVTRIAPLVALAPPTKAANPPNIARKTSDAPATSGTRYASGAIVTASKGKAARPRMSRPTRVPPARASATSSSEVPSSSRARAAVIRAGGFYDSSQDFARLSARAHPLVIRFLAAAFMTGVKRWSTCHCRAMSA
jgi:hypothetical protein